MSKRRPKLAKSRAETKQATRLALIEAGIVELGAHGLEASLDSICDRANLTRGAFYVHFADRDDFLIAVMQHVLGSFITAMTAQQPANLAGSIESFFAAARAQSPMVHGGTGLRFHHVMEACRRSRQIGTTYRNVVMLGRDQLAAGVARDQQAGAARVDLPADALADVLIVVALGVTTMTELGLPLDLARLASSLTALAAR